VGAGRPSRRTTSSLSLDHVDVDPRDDQRAELRDVEVRYREDPGLDSFPIFETTPLPIMRGPSRRTHRPTSRPPRRPAAVGGRSPGRSMARRAPGCRAGLPHSLRSAVTAVARAEFERRDRDGSAAERKVIAPPPHYRWRAPALCRPSSQKLGDGKAERSGNNKCRNMGHPALETAPDKCASMLDQRRFAAACCIERTSHLVAPSP
jgi:hypothetical protein